jgi:hypothetical protein
VGARVAVGGLAVVAIVGAAESGGRAASVAGMGGLVATRR